MQLQVHGLRSSRFHVGGPFAAAAVDLQLATLVGAIQLPAAACSCLTAATTLQDGASVETSSAIVDTLKLAHNQLTSLAGLAGEHSVGPLLAPPPASLSLLCALCSIPFPSSSAPHRPAPSSTVQHTSAAVSRPSPGWQTLSGRSCSCGRCAPCAGSTSHSTSSSRYRGCASSPFLSYSKPIPPLSTLSYSKPIPPLSTSRRSRITSRLSLLHDLASRSPCHDMAPTVSLGIRLSPAAAQDALAELPALSICYLHSNRFPSLAALGGLRPLVRLKKLTLHGSPLADVPNGLAMVKYRRSVMQLVPWIKELDFTAVTAADRSKKDAQGQNKRVEAMLSRLKLAEAATGAREEELAAQEEDTSPFGSVMAGGGDADGSPTGSPRTGARALKAASKRKKKKAADRSVEQEGRAVLKRLAEYIKAEKSNVVQIFRMFDADGSGPPTYVLCCVRLAALAAPRAAIVSGFVNVRSQ